MTTDRIRHACARCGGSCQGVRVVLVDAEEIGRIRARAERLGIDAPVDGGILRRRGGVCVFLGDDRRCRLHARWGPAAKPALCRQFPLVAVRGEEGPRVGIDPACYAAIRTWRTGPSVGSARLVVGRPGGGPPRRSIEAAVLGVLAGARSVEEALCTLVGEEAGDGGLPAAFLERWRRTVFGARLDDLADDPDTAPILGAVVRDLAAPPAGDRPLSLTPNAQAYALDAVRRVVWLRLGAPLDHPSAVALLALGGAVLSAWASDDDDGFGWRLAGWLRALRAPNVVLRLLPDPARLRWLVEGVGPPG